MGTHGKFAYSRGDFVTCLRELRPEILAAPPVQLALQFFEAYHSSNYVGFFTLVRRAGYLFACLGHWYFHTMRAWGLRLLTQGPANRALIPLSKLVRMVRSCPTAV
jgi:hypothetical protein